MKRIDIVWTGLACAGAAAAIWGVRLCDDVEPGSTAPYATLADWQQALPAADHVAGSPQLDRTAATAHPTVRKLAVAVSGYFDPTSRHMIEFRSGEVLIGLKQGVSREFLLQHLGGLGFTIGDKRGANSYLASGPDAELLELVAALKRVPGVEFAEPNFLLRASEAPEEDPKMWSQGGLMQIRAPQSWSRSTGRNVVVAILDTGVNSSHEDLDRAVLPGVDLVNHDDDADDDHGHGTKCAGIVAARRGNGKGITGVAPDAQILPVKILGADGTGTYADLADGIRWAESHGADVISISAAGTAPSTYLKSAVRSAHEAGIVVVAAAGNNGAGTTVYPAAYDEVVGVGAINREEQLTDYSNFGPSVDIVAPGNAVLGASMSGGYESITGTSASTPLVAGVAALVRGRTQSRRNSNVFSQLLDSAAAITSAERSVAVGAGMVDAERAVGLGSGIKVVHVESNPREPSVATLATVRFAVQNRETESKSVPVVVSVNGEQLDGLLVGPLLPGQVHDAEVPFIPDAVGPTEICVSLGSSDVAPICDRVLVRDSGFSDVGVERIDLGEQVLPDPDHGDLEFSVTVRNRSSSIANNELVCAARHLAEDRDDDVIKVVGKEPLALGAGEEAEIRMSWKVPSAGAGDWQLQCELMSSDGNPGNQTSQRMVRMSQDVEVAVQYRGTAHKTIMAQAIEFLRGKHNRICGPVCTVLEKNDFLSAFEAASDSEDRDKTAFRTSGNSATISTDPLLNQTVPNTIPWAQQKEVTAIGMYVQTLDHFWNADDDPGGTKAVNLRGFDPDGAWDWLVDLVTPDDSNMGGNVKSALAKARIHLENARFFYNSSRASPYVPRAPSSTGFASIDGIGLGTLGTGSPASDLEKSIEMLGRALHLLQDMSVPAHALNDLHPDEEFGDREPYENHYLPWAFGSAGNTNPSLKSYSVPVGNPTDVDLDAWRYSMDGPRAMHYLFFASNQAAQFFASRNVGGNRNVPDEFSILSSGDFYTRISYDARVNPCCTYPANITQIAEGLACQLASVYLYPHAVLATAAMLEVFERDVMHLADVDTLITVTSVL